jgi:ATP-binding cassette subfamily C protein CydC
VSDTTANIAAAVPTMRASLLQVLRDTDISRGRVALSIAIGTGALGSAVGLAAVAAWLIAKAAGMPSPADLALAAVAVRTFGIGRGLFRYLERVASHDTALRGVVSLRERTYERMADSGAAAVLSLKRGDILARVGADIDSVGDLVVRGIVPAAVAAVVSMISVTISLAILPVAGLILAGCLLAAAVIPALLTWRASARAANARVEARARVSQATLSLIDSAPEHRVWGTGQAATVELAEANKDVTVAHELTAGPAALSSAVHVLAQGVALISGLWLAVTSVNSGALPATTASVIALLPLAAFEGVMAIPAAVEQLFASRAAAARLAGLADATDGDHARAREQQSTMEGAGTATLTLRELSAAWPGMAPTPALTVHLEPGDALGIVGRSGIGKTTLLTTIAGALPPHAGAALLDGEAVAPHHTGHAIAVTPEDAHVFGTTVLDNLRVARGDVTESTAEEVLSVVGLRPWLDSLPQGLATELGTGGNTLSGGERRRLLLARALVHPAPIQLIDEPAEHLDEDGRDAVRAVIRAMRATGRTVVIVTHDPSILDSVDQVVNLDE